MARQSSAPLTCCVCHKPILARAAARAQRTAAGLMHGECYARNVEATTRLYQEAIEQGRHPRPREQ